MERHPQEKGDLVHQTDNPTLGALQQVAMEAARRTGHLPVGESVAVQNVINIGTKPEW